MQQCLEIYAQFLRNLSFRIKKQLHSGNKIELTLPLQVLLTDEPLTFCMWNKWPKDRKLKYITRLCYKYFSVRIYTHCKNQNLLRFICNGLTVDITISVLRFSPQTENNPYNIYNYKQWKVNSFRSRLYGYSFFLKNCITFHSNSFAR